MTMSPNAPRLVAGVAALMVSASALAEPADVVRAYVDAYNAHDVNAMLALVDDDLTWFMIEEDEMRTEISGTKYLELGMTAFFQAMPEGRSEIRALTVSGSFVSVVEEAFWQTADDSGSQCAMAVYEVIDELIHRVWYYDSHPCDAPASPDDATIRQN